MAENGSFNGILYLCTHYSCKQKMAHIYLSLGSNLGDKAAHLAQAVHLLGERVGKLVRLTDNYESAPWGFESVNGFLNNVVELETNLAPMALLGVTQEIEKELGRTQKSVAGYADRIIDIDILLYDQQIWDEPELKIPHPLLTERDFVLVPLCQIAADKMHPVTGRTFGSYLA